MIGGWDGEGNGKGGVFGDSAGKAGGRAGTGGGPLDLVHDGMGVGSARARDGGGVGGGGSSFQERVRSYVYSGQGSISDEVLVGHGSRRKRG